MGLPDLPPEKSVCRSRSNSYNWTWNSRLVPNWERSEYVKAIYCHPAYLTFMQSASGKMSGWMKHKLESRCQQYQLERNTNINWEKYQLPQICRWHHHYGRQQRTKEPLDESERGEWKAWLKTQHSENEDHGIWSYHFMANRCGNNGNSGRLCFLGVRDHCRWRLQPWN